MNELKYKYITIENASSFEFKEKGSKFIGLTAFCDTELKVKEQLLAWKTQHPQASHLCYAYRLGLDGKLYRANDDGEPSNSAGAPILRQIDSYNLTNVLVGVLRYYGGTKLGVGGLVSAYKMASKEVLEMSGKLEKELVQQILLTCSYDDLTALMDYLKRNRIQIKSTELNEQCSIVLHRFGNQNLDFESLERNCNSLKIKDLGWI